MEACRPEDAEERPQQVRRPRPFELAGRAANRAGGIVRPYAKTSVLWDEAGIGVPPVFILVCNNTSVSKLVYDFVSGFVRESDGVFVQGRFDLFRNYNEYGDRLSQPRTLLIDSEQLESGEDLDKPFREINADAIERFRRELVQRTGDARAGEKIRTSCARS